MIRKMILRALTLLPIASIAFAASSALILAKSPSITKDHLVDHPEYFGEMASYGDSTDAGGANR